MPVNDDKKYGRAAKWFCMNADMSMCEAMRAAGFSDQEAMNETFHKRVRRRAEYKQLNNNLNGIFEEVAAGVDNREQATDPPALNGAHPPVAIVPATLLDASTPVAATQKKPTTDKIRSTSSQKQKKLVAKKRTKAKASVAHKEATTRLAREWAKKNNPNLTSPQIGARKVVDQVNRKHQTNLNSRTVTRYTRAGKIGESPMKKGPEGAVSDRIMKILVGAFDSFVQINQGNGNGAMIERRELTRRVNQVTSPLFAEPKYSDRLYVRLIKNSFPQINVQSEHANQKRH